MALTLPTVRYFTAASPYHYTEDNKPLQDLASRDDALNTAFQAFSNVNQQAIAVGNWGTLSVALDLTQDIGKPFAYKIRTWAIQDQAIASTQNATYFEDLILGFSSAAGAITISSTVSLNNNKTGTSTLVRTYTPTTNTLTMTFTGYSGASAYVLSKAERFGI